MNKRTTFRSNRELFHADTCQPLKAAARQGDLCLAALGRGSYLTRTRMEAASRFLTLQPELSVTEIAFRCGFQSSQYFANVFRRQHGHSPSEHRRSIL